MKKFLIIGCIAIVCSSVCTKAMDSNTNLGTTEQTTEAAVSNEDNAGEDINNMTLSKFKDTIKNEADVYGNLSYSDVFSLMKESLNQGENISLEDAMNLSGGLTVPSNMFYDLADSGLTGKIDNSILNIQYGGLISQMNQNYQAIDLSSKSQGAVNLFESQYGDIAKNITLDGATLPEGWSMQDMITNNNNIINNSYNTAYQNSNYATIRNSMNISGIFGQASKGAVAYNLASSGQLNSQVSQLASQYKNDAVQKRNEARKDSQILASQNFASISSTKDYVDSFHVDDNGNLISPYDSQINAAVDQANHDNMSHTADNHPFTAIKPYDFSDDGYASAVDGNSSAMAQVTSGYIFQEWLDVFTGNGVADSGDSLNALEYVFTGQWGEDIYDATHKQKPKWGFSIDQ